MARFPFRIDYCGKPARHTGVSHLLRLLVMQTCLCLSYHMAPTAVNISPASYLYRFTRSWFMFPRRPPSERLQRTTRPRAHRKTPQCRPRASAAGRARASRRRPAPCSAAPRAPRPPSIRGAASTAAPPRCEKSARLPPALRVPSRSSVSPALSIKTADGRPYGRPSVGFRSYFS